MGTVVGLALTLVVAGASLSASAAPGQDAAGPLSPVETPGTDPVLDEVPVVPTSATRDTEDRYTNAEFKRSLAVLKAIGAEKTRKEQDGRVAEADRLVEEATGALAAAKGTRDDEADALAERQETQRKRRAALAVQEDSLRELAIGVYISAPTDDFAWLGPVEDLSQAEQRDAARDRTVEQQSARVEEVKRPWEDARDATAAQQDVLDAAEDQVVASDDALAEAVDARDNSAEVLREARKNEDDRKADATEATEEAHEAAVTRRQARLTAIVKGQDLRLVALDAYWRAAGGAACNLPWWVLAGVGRTETRHGTAHGSELTAEGDTTTHILGIALDGRPGVATIGDSDGGALDGDTTFDRAVGPMQFIPGTWRRWARDGNADGKADPHNIYDAAAAAAAYLCFGRSDLTTEPAQRAALLSYNRSVPYGTTVLASGNEYRAALDLPDRPEPSATSAPAGGN